MSEVLGSPRLSDANYESEAEVFQVRLQDAVGTMDRKIKVFVPLEEAPEFKANLAEAKPQIQYDLVNNELSMTAMAVVLNDTRYHAEPGIVNFTPSDVANTSTAANRNITEDIFEKINISGLDIGEDAIQQLIAEEEAKLKIPAIDAVDYGSLLPVDWRFKRLSHIDANNSMMVIIANEDYQHMPDVSSAKRDGQAVRTFAKQALGLNNQQIIYVENANLTDLKDVFEHDLPNGVDPNKTHVYVYFSGHGLTDGNARHSEMYLMPVSARPHKAETGGYSRQKLVQNLAKLRPASLTLVLDACFTGEDKQGQTFVASKPAFAVPQSPVVSLPDNSLFISAGQSDQLALIHKHNGHSLLTYHWLEAMQGKADTNRRHGVSSRELQHYLRDKVKADAWAMYQKKQQPYVVVSGYPPLVNR